MNEEDIANILIVRALAQLLKDDEGIVIHHEGDGYLIYNNSVQETITVVLDDDYLNIEHGKLIWMHYEGSNAPEQAADQVFEEMVPDTNTTKH